MVSNNRKGNLYMALICSPALKWHNMAEPTFAHFWMWSRCCLRHQVWRSEAASYVKNSGGRIAKNWNRCSISRLHGEMTCRILNWNVHEHNGHTTYRSLGQVLKVPHLARQKKCLKGRGRFFSKLWWNASGISSSSSAEIARKLPAVFAAQIDQQITFHNVQISNLHSFHLLPICCCLGGAFLSPYWCYLAGPGEPPNLDQPFHPNFKPRPTTRRSPARSRKQCLQRYQRRWSTSHFPSGFTGDEDENHGHSAMLFCEGIHVATFFQISWIFTSGTFWTWELLPLCPCCRLPHRPLKPKSSNFRSLSFLQIMQIITKKGAVNFWTLSETWQPYTLATSYILPHDGVLPDPKRTETLTQGVWCRWWERLEVRCANLQSQCPWPQQTRHPIHSHPFRSHQLRVQQVPSSCFQPAPSMGLWPWGRKEESPDATFLHSSDASRPPQVESVQSPAPAPAREETARQWS